MSVPAFRPWANSFRSEKALIAERDAYALWYKHRASLTPAYRLRELGHLLTAEEFREDAKWRAPFARVAKFGAVKVCNDEVSIVKAKSGPYAVEIDGENVNMLHIGACRSGVQQLREDMGNAAAYLNRFTELRYRELVLGVTYREMASLAVRLGFQEMELEEVEEQYGLNVQAAHMTFRALNPRDETSRPRPFEVRAICIPTDQFAEVFPPQVRQQVYKNSA